MPESLRKRCREHALWLSLLGHFLFFGSFILVIHFTADKAPPLPSAAVSAYAVTAMAMPTPAVTPSPPTPTPIKTQEKSLKKTKDIVEKPMKAVATPKPAAQAKPLQGKREIRFSKASPPIDLTNPYDREPLHLVGESKIVPPLVRILARAIGQHLYYPRVAAEFNLRGVVLVGFVLHPEGYITDVRVVKSSDAGVLDDAARDGVAAVATVGQVSEYVDKPEFLVIGVIFG